MKLTSEQLSFLARLAKSPDGKALISILEGYLGSTDYKLRSASGEEIFRQQGRAQQLQELVETISKAEATLDRLKPVPSQAHRFMP